MAERHGAHRGFRAAGVESAEGFVDPQREVDLAEAARLVGCRLERGDELIADRRAKFTDRAVGIVSDLHHGPRFAQSMEGERHRRVRVAGDRLAQHEQHRRGASDVPIALVPGDEGPSGREHRRDDPPHAGPVVVQQGELAPLLECAFDVTVARGEFEQLVGQGGGVLVVQEGVQGLAFLGRGPRRAALLRG